jgi:hypothetical protein
LGDGIAAAKIEKHNARAINAADGMKRSIRLVSLLVYSCCSVLTENVNGIVYVAYSGYAGDYGSYHGWVVGVDSNDPSSVAAWAATAIGGGIWGHGGVASDGTNMFVVTGNTFNTGGNWMGGEAIIRLQAGPGWTGEPTDYWAPTNWLDLDNTDSDLGGISATVIDVPGATLSQLVLAG